MLLDEAEAERQAERKRAEIQRYRAAREEIEQQREQDRLERNQLKRSQIELFERMQVRRHQRVLPYLILISDVVCKSTRGLYF